MGEKSFTLFEINLHEPSFNAKNTAPGLFRRGSKGGSDGETEADSEADREDGEFQSIEVDDGDAEESVETDAEGIDAEDVDVEDSDVDADSSGRGKSALVALVFLAALAVAVKVMTGEDVEELAELDDLADVNVDGEETDGESNAAALDEEEEE